MLTGGVPVDPAGDAELKCALLIGVLCGNADYDAETDTGSGDPMEVALLRAGALAGLARRERPSASQAGRWRSDVACCRWPRDRRGSPPVEQQGDPLITRDVEATTVADLALAPPRAALAANVGDEICLLPINLHIDDEADPAWSPRVMQVPRGTPDLAGRNVVVIADDGPQWFRLRSLTVRRTAIALGDQSYRLGARVSIA